MVSCDSEARCWPILLASFVINALTLGVASSMGVFYVEWRGYFPQSSAVVGWLTASMSALLLWSSPLAGALTRYFSVRLVVVAGAILSSTGLLIASLASNFYVLAITVPFMAGIGCGLSYTAGVWVITSQCFPQNFALASGIASAGGSLGTVVLPVVFRFLIDSYEWRGALMIVSAVHANVLVCAGFLNAPAENKSTKLLKGNSKHNYKSMGSEIKQGIGLNRDNYSDDDASESTDGLVNGRERSSDGVSLVFKKWWAKKAARFLDRTGLRLFCNNKVYLSYLLVILVEASVTGITFPYLTARARSTGVSELKAASLVSVVGISSTVGGVTSGRLVDSAVIPLPAMYSSLLALCAVSAALIAVFESYAVLVACALVIGLAVGTYIPLSATFVRKMVGQERFPGGMGITLWFVSTGYMLAAFLGGLAHDLTKNYSSSFYVLACESALAALLLLALHVLWTRLIPDERWPVCHADASKSSIG